MQRIKLEGTQIGDTAVLEYAGQKKYRCKCLVCGKEFISDGEALRLVYNTTCNHNADSWKQDMLNKTFNEWQVLEYVGDSKFKCKCSCGSIKIVSKFDLINGKSKSCGHNKFIDLTGYHVGTWEVLKYAGNGLWICQCECGNIMTISGVKLRGRYTVNCGHTRLKESLRGKTFGEWTVVHYTGNGQWLCRCSCGTEKIVSGFALKNSRCKSCGHDHTSNAFIDLTGMTIGELLVLEYLGDGLWKCRCSCGKPYIARGRYLRESANPSCGHIQRELSQLSRNPNRTIEQLSATRSRENMLRFIGGSKLDLLDLSKRLGISYSHTVRLCNQYNLHDYLKIVEHPKYKQAELTEFIQELVGNRLVVSDDRTVIPPKEVDIYIPDMNTAIEFNGNYWHSNYKKEVLYHQNKSIEALRNGVRLIHIFEYEWDNLVRQDAIKRFLRFSLVPYSGMSENNVFVHKIGEVEANQFEDQHFLFGGAGKAIHIGLFCNQRLVGVMSFIPKNSESTGEFQLARMCFRYGIDNQYKLMVLNYFIQNYKARRIKASCHMSKYDTNEYLQLGFNYTKTEPFSSPRCVWVLPDSTSVIAEKDISLNQLNAEGFSEYGKSTDEIMQNLGFLRIYDSGYSNLELTC